MCTRKKSPEMQKNQDAIAEQIALLSQMTTGQIQKNAPELLGKLTIQASALSLRVDTYFLHYGNPENQTNEA